MNLKNISPGTHVVTVSGDVAELLEVTGGGASARVRYLEVLGGAEASVGSEATLPAEDIATVDGNRFIGPPRTASSSKP